MKFMATKNESLVEYFAERICETSDWGTPYNSVDLANDIMEDILAKYPLNQSEADELAEVLERFTEGLEIDAADLAREWNDDAVETYNQIKHDYLSSQGAL